MMFVCYLILAATDQSVSRVLLSSILVPSLVTIASEYYKQDLFNYKMRGELS